MSPSDIYPLSLHDALPIFMDPPLVEQPAPVSHTSLYLPQCADLYPFFSRVRRRTPSAQSERCRQPFQKIGRAQRLNSSHLGISYAVFCLKKKNRDIENHNI